MSARTKARKRALDMLFQADVRQEPILSIVNAEAKRAAGEPDRAASWLYAREIVDGVADHREEIDELLVSYAQGWTLDRMPHVDRALLRIAAWEILFNAEVPAAVAIDEAIELAKEYSTDDSGRFVNGVLGKIADHAAS
ncbi:transcription antitermination factor NusB [Leucobacter massiliensis]|uniref:Transcription antitermination protein NusB n=1 Tax=Leucobacter massiliensis TaxID=1686285 RepID=A0A2S9QRJ6_9MICO|nr:transcription antitermination factor NusB [Leucobacter massiliensis]PRI12213.1 transcription antitermination factor NusB [Leucobacter massiliensis]